MLTFVENLSLAGDRNKQNDDACGFLGARAWVLDGATDLHDAPLTGWASDASWLAHFANAQLHTAEGLDLRASIREASAAAALAFRNLNSDRAYEKWQSPISSLLMIEECRHGVSGIDLGDSRVFALDDSGAAFAVGGPDYGVDPEVQLAAQQKDGDKPLLKRESTLAMLRTGRARLNQAGASWTFGIDPECAAHARTWDIPLKRPAYLLLMTDGFAALTDRYGAYEAGALVRACVERGLQELGRELRAIEAEDAGGAKHPRFKKSDDATALLMRLT